MADWKTHISYGYNPAYLAYAYGHMFQPGQNAGNQGEPEVTDLSSNNVGVTQNYYTTTAETQEGSPPRTPEHQVSNGHYHYQSAGVLYIDATQTSRFLLAGSRQPVYDERALETKRAGSDSTSDSETYISPDLDKETSNKSPVASEDVSSSLTEERGKSCASGIQTTLISPKNPGVKAKARTAFSESQMNILVHKFSIQRYLPPSEMKNLAEVTGLTYKQNRRMKLRRHQKDSSWISERYAINNGAPVNGTVYNIPPYSPSYQGEGRPQHMVDTAFKNTAPQNVALYMATVGPGSAGYPSWTSVPQQTAVPIRTQHRDWPTNPNTGHYEYNPHVFNVGFSSGQCTSLESKNGESVDNSS
ncbi:hypothetical protein fugu_015916 [Takifugu bimaculatus]|uniref:Homeobox domain-containing protein n=1 Tax=Takifugu bimaculatus TaxID=433685 RepID=A0A4Z2BVL0_9TELE|nr:hypothetical protein fugu_015916 [Takifugu bimaculatus]